MKTGASVHLDMCHSSMRTALVTGTLLENYDTVRQVMEITLGPAILNKSVESHCLEFHPSKFKTEDNNGTESGL